MLSCKKERVNIEKFFIRPKEILRFGHLIKFWEVSWHKNLEEDPMMLP